MRTKLELIEDIRKILNERCDDPAQQMIEHGTALVEIGKALKGQTFKDARAIIEAVAMLDIG